MNSCYIMDSLSNTTQPNQSAIKEVMLPFMHNLQDQNMLLIAFDLYGNIIYTNSFTQSNYIKKNNIFNLNMPLDNSTQKMREIYQLVMNTKKIAHFLYISDEIIYDNEFEFLVTRAQCIPFFNEKHEVIASYIFGMPISLLNIEKLIFTKDNFKDINQNLTGLSKREHEILFLLSYNILQSHIATHLGISRSTVNTLIFERIMPKFKNINTVDKLVDIAIQSGIHYKLPKAIIKPKIVLIEYAG